MVKKTIDHIGDTEIQSERHRTGFSLSLVQGMRHIELDRSDVAVLIMTLLRWYFTTEDE